MGDELWTRTVASNDDSGMIARGIAVDSQGRPIVAGSSGENGGLPWLRKYTPDGQTVWTREPGPSGVQRTLYDVAVGPNDEIVCVGGILGDNDDDDDAWIVALDDEGNNVWSDQQGLPNTRDLATGVAIDSSGDLTVVATFDWNFNEPTLWIRKYTADGEVRWTDEPGPASVAFIRPDVAIDSTDAIVVAGATVENDESVAWLRKYTP
jgi:hypothetical protein